MLRRMWAIDVEGSGRSPPEIVELAIAGIEGLQLTGLRMHWLFKPRHGISPDAERIHGISERDVENSPVFEDVADDLLERLEDVPIVGHNVRVEVSILSKALDGWRPAAAYDTLKLARRFLPLEEKHGLGYLGAKLGLDVAAAELTGGRPHSAPYDAVLSALLLAHLLKPLCDPEREAVLLDADVLRDAQGSLL